MKSLQSVKETLLANPQVRSDYDALQGEFDLARVLIEARTRAGLSQGEVALRMGTTQSVIARLESGKRLPSLRTLQRYAQAIGAFAVFSLTFPKARHSGRGAAASR